jgi:putative DNA-invertase from lambdoid prophage Rac
MLRAGLYARVSTNDQQTLWMQHRAMREYATRRGWTVAVHVREVNSGAARREARETLLETARRRDIDVVLVWRRDRWGRSVTDLLATLQELEHLGVGFVSITEALDLTTPAGRAMAGLLAIFAEFKREILRERTRAGLAHARENGKRLGSAGNHGRTRCGNPQTVSCWHQQIRNRAPRTDRPYIGPPAPANRAMKRPKRDPERENRIHNEAIADSSPDEQAMSWYYYLQGKIGFPFRRSVSPRMQSRRYERVRPSRSYAWPWSICASTTCLCRSVGKAARWQSLSLNWALSIQTNQPKKPSATGITGLRRETACNNARPPKAHELHRLG